MELLTVLISFPVRSLISETTVLTPHTLFWEILGIPTLQSIVSYQATLPTVLSDWNYLSVQVLERILGLSFDFHES